MTGARITEGPFAVSAMGLTLTRERRGSRRVYNNTEIPPQEKKMHSQVSSCGWFAVNLKLRDAVY